MPQDPVRRAFQALQSKVRAQPPAELGRFVTRRNAPGGLRSPTFGGFTLYEYQRVEWEKAHEVIGGDPRFEHMGTRKLDDELWWLVCAAHLGRTGIVNKFVADFERQPQTFVHYFPVEHLVVDAAIALPGARLLPAGAVAVPPPILAFEPELADRAVVEVEATGTDLKLMMGRARLNAEHGLRVLRATLAESKEIRDSRLRFVLASTGWRDDSTGTYSDRPVTPTQITVAMYTGLVAGHPVSGLPVKLRNDVEAHAELALRWFERAQMTEDQLTRLLFLFFAIEAILGDRSASMKGANLAVRRAMLGFVTTGRFVDPSRIFVYYDEVRSNAVHGEEPIPVTRATSTNSAPTPATRSTNSSVTPRPNT